MDNDENLWKEIDEDKLDGFLKDEEYIKQLYLQNPNLDTDIIGEDFLQ